MRFDIEVGLLWIKPDPQLGIGSEVCPCNLDLKASGLYVEGRSCLIPANQVHCARFTRPFWLLKPKPDPRDYFTPPPEQTDELADVPQAQVDEHRALDEDKEPPRPNEPTNRGVKSKRAKEAMEIAHPGGVPDDLTDKEVLWSLKPVYKEHPDWKFPSEDTIARLRRPRR
jgi:hypothetical protein